MMYFIIRYQLILFPAIIKNVTFLILINLKI